MFLGAPDFARSEKKHSHRFSIFCVFTQPRSLAATRPGRRRGSYTPESGRDSRPQARQLWAISGLLQCSKDRLYSITSSARTRTDGGIFNPSALAALLLTINSSLVGNSTGRSPGLAPLRIFFT